jgi:hypothetical protein
MTNAVNVAALGSGPAFRASTTSTQSISSGTWTKIVYDTKEWDTNTNYSTANARFTPTVAGYYQLSGGVLVNNNQTIYLVIYKNGVSNTWLALTGTATVRGSWGSALVYANGTTDYFEMYVYLGGAQTLNGSAEQNYFTGALSRAA